jgi:anti-sigma factor RsiW
MAEGAAGRVDCHDVRTSVVRTGDGGCGEPQLRASLSLYLIGVLPADESTAFERHLGTCTSCQSEADRVGEAALLLALLPDADRDRLVAEFGPAPVERTPVTADPPAVVPLPGAAAPLTGGAVVGRPGGAAVGRPGGAAVGRPGGAVGGPVRPPRHHWRSRRLRLVGAGLAVVLIVLAGAIVGQPTRNWLSGADPSTTLVANAADESTGATLSVTVTARGDEVTLRAAITGLTADAVYRLYVTDIDGRSWELVASTGTGRPQEVTADCPVTLDRILRFSVTAADGSLVVAAPVEPHRPSPPS